MRTSKIIIIVFSLFILISITTNKTLAAEWSDLCNITRIDNGKYSTVIYCSTLLPNGSKRAYLDADNQDHNRIMSLAMMAMNSKLDVKLYMEENFVERIAILSSDF